MKHKTMLLALVVVSGLLYALPSMASAAGWDIDPAPTEKSPLTFTSSGAKASLVTAGGNFSCTASSGTGKYTSQTTGNITITFTGCATTFFGFPITCTSSGQSSGTIKTTENLVFHNIMIESTAQVAGGTPGILVTPNSGHFATFVCAGNTVVVGGTGVIGDISSPKCGETSTTSTLKFEASGVGVQKYTQEETTGTKYDQTSSKNGGAPETASQEAEGKVTFNQAATITCP